MSILVSSLPKNVQHSAMMMVEDISGELGPKEVATAITNLEKQGEQNRNLKKVIAAFVSLTFLMVAAIFASSIAAANLSQEMTISPETGFAYAKGSDGDVIKTGVAMQYSRGASVGEMSNSELLNLEEIILADGNLRFKVKGHARDESSDTVVLLVEGGTITYHRDYLESSTGNAKLIFEFIFGEDAHVEGSDAHRKLHTACFEDVLGFRSKLSKELQKRLNFRI